MALRMALLTVIGDNGLHGGPTAETPDQQRGAGMISGLQNSPAVLRKLKQHRKIWDGVGPSLLFVPRRLGELYEMTDYRRRFADPARMLESELARAREVQDWPTDGIPTVRPNLGTIFVPGSAGQSYEVRSGSMPWPGATLGREEIRALQQKDLTKAELVRRALEFYRLAKAEPDFYAYHADTQGVFDIAHLIYGTSIFTDLAMDDQRQWVMELMELALEWYVEISRILKEVIGEPPGEMIHGHGTEQGLYFPNAGVRISEDTATLLSPEMIERDLLSFMERSVEPFGGAFVHYCGKHDALFQMLCDQEWCRAIDLGNPEMYEFPALAETCAETGTVFHSRVAALEGEGWREYVERISTVVRDSGARCVLRAMVFPETRHECEEMLGVFHAGTAVS